MCVWGGGYQFTRVLEILSRKTGENEKEMCRIEMKMKCVGSAGQVTNANI